MTLGFSQEIKGVKNFFVAKIWRSFLSGVEMNGKQFINAFNALDDETKGKIDHVKPKPHTIRQGNRWRAGMDIHMVINNRTVNRFQFAPTIKCVSVQSFSIEWNSDGGFVINIDKMLFAYQPHKRNSIAHLTELERLAINDGFDSVQAFLEYFNKNFTGQLIHWTDLKY